MNWRVFFWAAAFFNFVAGLPLLLAPEVMLGTLELPVPSDLMFHRMTGLLVVCFGAVYGFVAQDLERFRPLVWLGVIGKGGVVVLFTQAFLQGLVPFSAYSVSSGDLAFTLGFIVFLLNGKRTP